MTHDELENLIYERTRYFVDVPVADCIFDLIAAEREACAKVCFDMAQRHNDIRSAALETASEYIRARGQ